MLSLLPYISAAGAFFAAMIAIVGKPKWDPHKSAFRKLTPTGRIAATLAIVALMSTSILTWTAQRAAETQRVQRDEIRKLAHTELRLALQELADPFVGLLIRARRQMRMDPTGPIRTSGKVFPACMLDRSDYALMVEEAHPTPRAFSGRIAEGEAVTSPDSNEGTVAREDFIRREWEEGREARSHSNRFAIKRDATSAAAAFDRILATYAAYLEPEILYSVAELRRSRWLRHLQQLGYPPGGQFGLHQRYWRIVEKLWNESGGLFLDPDSEEVWGPDHFLMMQLRNDEGFQERR